MSIIFGKGMAKKSKLAAKEGSTTTRQWSPTTKKIENDGGFKCDGDKD